MPYVIIVITLGYAAAVTDVVIESARTGGRTIVAFGTTLFQPGLPQGIWILCGVSASAALVVTVAVAHARGRRLERRVAAELDARYDQLSARAAGDVARERLLDGRIAELQTSIDTLTAQRDDVYNDVMRARERLNAAGQVISVPDAAELEASGASEGTVVVPEAAAKPEPPRSAPEPTDTPASGSERRAGNNTR